MKCPKCGGKIIVIDIVQDDDDNKTYRKRKCLNCDHIFFTTEFEAERTYLFINNWQKKHRSYRVHEHE